MYKYGVRLIEKQTKLTGNIKTAVDYFVSELTNNVADHSECKYGMMFAQTYPNKGYIDICILDNGVGLYRSYNKSLKFHPGNEVEAVEMALHGKSTKDVPESRGFGLSTSKDIIINPLAGAFVLWTGETFFIEKGEIKNILQIGNAAYFQGCFLALRLSLNKKDTFDLYDYIS